MESSNLPTLKVRIKDSSGVRDSKDYFFYTKQDVSGKNGTRTNYSHTAKPHNVPDGCVKGGMLFCNDTRMEGTQKWRGIWRDGIKVSY
jgi:hypothetical protein